MKKETPSVAQGKDLVITREFDAPVEVVWKAWTEPEAYKKWWGPKDFTCPTAHLDVRVGGKFLSSMRAADGQEFWATGVYKEIIPLRKLVFTDSFADAQGNVVPSTHYGMAGIPLEMLVTVAFERVGGKTRMTMTHAGLPSEHARDASAGWNESFDKMAAHLTQAHEHARQ